MYNYKNYLREWQQKSRLYRACVQLQFALILSVALIIGDGHIAHSTFEKILAILLIAAYGGCWYFIGVETNKVTDSR